MAADTKRGRKCGDTRTASGRPCQRRVGRNGSCGLNHEQQARRVAALSASSGQQMPRRQVETYRHATTDPFTNRQVRPRRGSASGMVALMAARSSGRVTTSAASEVANPADGVIADQFAD